MPQIMSLPADNQEAFRQAVKAAQAKRGNYLTAAEMIQAAETMGAPDPFPIGVPFSNQVPVEPPKTKEQIGKANMREAMQRQLAEREAGIRAYESQTGNRPGQSDATREAIFSNRTQNLLSGQGQIPEKRAAYILQQRENESARNRALAAAQEYVQSQPSGLMQLEDYRDPRGAFARKMQERAFGLREQQMAGESADRADELGLRRNGLNIERDKLASQERLASEGATRDDDREARKEELQFKVLELQQNLENARADRNIAAQRELQAQKIAADKELAQLEADTRSKGIVPPEQQAALEVIARDPNMSADEKLAAIARLRGGQATQASSEAPMYPNMPSYLQGLAKEAGSVEEFLDNINIAAADSPAEQELVKRFILQTYGAEAFRKFEQRKEYDFGWLRNALGSRGYATQKQNRKRGLVGLPPNQASGNGLINQAAGAASIVNPLTAPTTLLIKALSR